MVRGGGSVRLILERQPYHQASEYVYAPLQTFVHVPDVVLSATTGGRRAGAVVLRGARPHLLRLRTRSPIWLSLYPSPPSPVRSREMSDGI